MQFCQVGKGLGLCVLVAMTQANISPAHSLAIVTISQVGNDVFVSASGTLNVASLTYIGGTGYSYGIDPDTSTFLINPGPFSSLYQGSFGLPASLGPGANNVLPTSGTGDQFGIALYFGISTLFVPGATGYSGAPINSSST
ncbi:MAG: hypothetical protein VKI83_01640 [Synechococcaceae cyanobacterium]|nr:hypothetical protein [Synechococcaceae cyanobacterium]